MRKLKQKAWLHLCGNSVWEVASRFYSWHYVSVLVRMTMMMLKIGFPENKPSVVFLMM